MATQTQSDAVAKVVRQFLRGIITTEEALTLLIDRLGLSHAEAFRAVHGEAMRS